MVLLKSHFIAGKAKGGVRNGSGQGHSTVNFPIRKEGGWSARLLILYSASIVKKINISLNRPI
jgi:hypothetical protein